MKITRDVITDLLAISASGEASADTRALVEEYLRSDPEFAAAVQTTTERPGGLHRAESAEAPGADVEKAALERSRTLLRRRAWALGLALFFTMVPFTTVHTESIRFFMLRDEPRSAFLLVIAAVFWVWHSRLNRRLAGSGV